MSRNFGSPSGEVIVATAECAGVGVPSNLRVVSTSTDSVGLSWDVVEGARRYKLEWAGVVGTTTSDWAVFSDTATSTSLVVDGLDCGQTYRFRISAAGDGVGHLADFGSLSDEVLVSTGVCLDVLDAPTGLRVTATSANSVGLSWTAVTSASQYKVEYALSPVGTITAMWPVATESATSAPAVVSELVCDEEYRFRVSSAGDGGKPLPGVRQSKY